MLGGQVDSVVFTYTSLSALSFHLLLQTCERLSTGAYRTRCLCACLMARERVRLPTGHIYGRFEF